MVLMKKIQQSIIIDAPREMVWAAIINQHKFRIWCAEFAPGSYFDGDWQLGQSIKFLGKAEDGQLMGMQAEIAVSEHLKRISIRHYALINGDAVDSDSDEAKKWVPAYENYELESVSPQSTRFSVDVDINEEYLADMAEAWSKALQKLKEVCEDNLAPFASITVSIEIQESMEKVWLCWTGPECIKKWNHALDSWHCPTATNDLRVGGRFSYNMAARDGSVSFDFAGTYTEVVFGERITSQLDDGRMVWVSFEASDSDYTKVVETFEAENENTLELQRNGWQSILDNFKKVVEENQ
ncbi:MAG: hypothetical protein CVU86_08255 [Firmicutes bacterium HGW-Firmicutes-11]|jgi:uncharacterized protein YndB with AHSA1/START domain|nr:MAG: hypothetical protein CVU86_08255 [Firmicutes bacterium HGW-Firmicutes-11]